MPTELLEGADEGVVETFWDAISELEAQGAEYHEVSLPSVEHAVEAYYVIAMSEASSNLARFDGVRYGNSGGYDGNWNEAFAKARKEGFGDEVKRRILLGTYALSAGYHDKYYKKAQDARAWVKQDFDDALAEADVLASPTMPVPPFELGESLEDPLQMYLSDANTVPRSRGRGHGLGSDGRADGPGADGVRRQRRVPGDGYDGCHDAGHEEQFLRDRSRPRRNRCQRGVRTRERRTTGTDAGRSAERHHEIRHHCRTRRAENA